MIHETEETIHEVSIGAALESSSREYPVHFDALVTWRGRNSVSCQLSFLMQRENTPSDCTGASYGINIVPSRLVLLPSVPELMGWG